MDGKRKKFVILDFQWFTISRNNVIPKELASCDSEHKKSHFLFKPIVSFGALSEEDQRVARFVTGSYTGLNWEGGFTNSCEFDAIVKQLCRNVDVVYVKGRQKLDFLKHIVNNRIVDLLEAGKITRGIPSCPFHNGNFVVCALRNVELLYTYINLPPFLNRAIAKI